MRTIQTEVGTKLSHEKYITWLNTLLNSYVSSFYDGAIRNIIELAFIKQHHLFLQELYQSEGKVLSSFMTVSPTDVTNTLMMIHQTSDGKPIYYNGSEVSLLFEFNDRGLITKFYENITIDLYDEAGTDVAECYIVFEDVYGIKAPMYIVKKKITNEIIGKGLLDLAFENRYSGSYALNNSPLVAIPYYEVTNISKVVLTVDVPILTDLNVRYEIPSNTKVSIPITEWSDYYLRQLVDAGSVTLLRQTP